MVEERGRRGEWIASISAIVTMFAKQPECILCSEMLVSFIIENGYTSECHNFCSFDVVKRETFDVRYVVLFFQHSAKAVLKTRICYDQLNRVGSKSLLKTSH